LFAVTLFKTIRLHVTRYLSGHALTISQYRIRLTKDGIPKVLGPLIPLIRKKNPADLRIILTVLNVGRYVPGDGTLDVSSIVSPRVGNLAQAQLLEQKLVTFSTKVLKEIIPKDFCTDWLEPHLSTKRGPNGQALGTALKDLTQLTPTLKEAIGKLAGKKLANYLCLLEPAAVGLNPDFKGSLRRISVIKDKECKNRPIAIFDYWSQTALRPLHNSLMRTLYRLKTDLTRNQYGVSQLLHIPSTSNYYSLDLTAATDRFPISLQEKILALIIGENKARAWKMIMTQPLSTFTGDQVVYSTGQPMGAYSSWAMFTLCHHLIVQYAAISPMKYHKWYNRYRILGDDIVILDQDVAHRYREIMTTLGVTISDAKSHVSKDTFEMAKRWFHKGTEISPYPFISLIENRSNPSGIAMALYTAMEKGWSTNL
jgi:hypothetical protein